MHKNFLSKHVLWSHISCNKVLHLEHSPSKLNAPTFWIHVNQAIPHKDTRLATTLKSSWTCMPASSAPKPAHALISWTKPNVSKIIPYCGICWEIWNAFLGCPSFTHSLRFWFHEKMFNYTVPGGIATIYVTTMMGLSTPQAIVFHHFFIFVCSTFWLFDFVWAHFEKGFYVDVHLFSFAMKRCYLRFFFYIDFSFFFNNIFSLFHNVLWSRWIDFQKMSLLWNVCSW